MKIIHVIEFSYNYYAGLAVIFIKISKIRKWPALSTQHLIYHNQKWDFHATFNNCTSPYKDRIEQYNFKKKRGKKLKTSLIYLNFSVDTINMYVI